jgi:hypothetical protein
MTAGLGTASPSVHGISIWRDAQSGHLWRCCCLQQVPAAALRKVAEQDPDNALGYYLVAIDKQTRKTCDKDVGESLKPADRQAGCFPACCQGCASCSAVARRRLLNWTTQTVSAHSHCSYAFSLGCTMCGHVLFAGTMVLLAARRHITAFVALLLQHRQFFSLSGVARL